MAHSLVQQLRFARSEFERCLKGVTPEEAIRRFEPLNCISWTIGHLADQENTFWVLGAQGLEIASDLEEKVGYGQPPSTPPLEEMWDVWQRITKVADDYLETINSEILQAHLEWRGRRHYENVGILLLRNTYHYWFHLGEAHAIRQFLGHKNLPQFVGDLTQVHF